MTTQEWIAVGVVVAATLLLARRWRRRGLEEEGAPRHDGCGACPAGKKDADHGARP